MVTVAEKIDFQIPIEKANFDLLLNGSNYIFIKGQLIYRLNGKFFLTNINNDKYIKLEE